MGTETPTLTKFDLAYGRAQDVGISTKASTVKYVQPITGKTETFIVQTFRHPDLGDTVFIERIDEDGVVRIVVPPKVASLIISQRDSLTKTNRSRTSKRVMRERMASGNWKPPVPPRRRKKA
jgi:hypothetical protein